MATTPRTEPVVADPPVPSAERLPVFDGVDVAALAGMTRHPMLREVAAGLLRNWVPAGEAVAYYDDGPGMWVSADPS